MHVCLHTRHITCSTIKICSTYVCRSVRVWFGWKWWRSVRQLPRKMALVSSTSPFDANKTSTRSHSMTISTHTSTCTPIFWPRLFAPLSKSPSRRTTTTTTTSGRTKKDTSLCSKCLLSYKQESLYNFSRSNKVYKASSYLFTYLTIHHAPSTAWSCRRTSRRNATSSLRIWYERQRLLNERVSCSKK